MKATAFAPSTVANVAVGFDILGFALGVVGDRVTVESTQAPEITIDSITGVVTDLPKDPGKNTAAVALQSMREALGIQHGYRVSIQKGIPMGSGMGGSAASAVGAVVAANALLDKPLSKRELLPFALAGEAAASGAIHADNVAPCLLGGLTLVASLEPLKIAHIPVPADIQCVLVHPHLKIETRHARSILKPTLLLREHVLQSARLAGFVTSCHSGDLELLSQSMMDLVIEPQRASLIPGFYEAKAAAMDQGALGFSISGSGPSVFAWTASRNGAERVRLAVLAALRAQGVEADSWVAPMHGPSDGPASGARLELKS